MATDILWLERIGLSEGLVAACIVGTLGLCGVLISLNFERKEEYKSFLRKKFEEVIFRLVDFSADIKEIEAKRFLNSIDKTLDLDKFYREGAKIEILITLYFSELEKGYKLFLEAGANLLVAQREYETRPNIDSLNSLKKCEDLFDKVYDSFYEKIKSCIPTHTYPLKHL